MKTEHSTIFKNTRVYPIRIGFLILLAGLGLLQTNLATQAQEEEPWTPIFQLSEGILDSSGKPAEAAFPVLVSDEWGGVHAFFPALVDVERIGGVGDTLYYVRWEGSAWSKPNDVVHWTEGIIWLPQVVVDSNGWFHVAWTDNVNGTIWYSRAPVNQAVSAHAWSTPMELTGGGASSISIEIGAEDNIHLMYCEIGEYEGVYHLSSKDGITWSFHSLVFDIPDFDFSDCLIRMAIDGRDRLHVALTMERQPSIVAYYARSEAGGQHWTTPHEIDRKNSLYWDDYGPTRANIEAIGSDQIHIIWDGSPAGQRWHVWSSNGGKSWYPPELIDEVHRGLTGINALGVDSMGRLHLVSMGLDGRAYHATWRDGSWSAFKLISDRGGQHPTLAIRSGKTLHAAWNLEVLRPIQIVSSQLETDSPSVYSTPLPTLMSNKHEQGEIEKEVGPKTGQSIATPIDSIHRLTEIESDFVEVKHLLSYILWSAVGPPILFVIVILIVKQYFLRR